MDHEFSLIERITRIKNMFKSTILEFTTIKKIVQIRLIRENSWKNPRIKLPNNPIVMERWFPEVSKYSQFHFSSF